jgi:RimJ/RimL family protein N-acetyltransferase
MWTPDDAEALVRHANNVKIWRNLYDFFPHPYRLEDARGWLAERQADGSPPMNFAIDHRGEAIGAIGLRRPAEMNTNCLILGYWLGEAYWGLGITSDAVRTLLPYAFKTFPFPRIEARTFHWNKGSQRVLERCGFTREGILRQRMVKNGESVDQYVYALLRSDIETQEREIEERREGDPGEIRDKQ